MDPKYLTGNYHTHTSRCGHADGIDEAFVRTAVDMGLKVLAFTDHVMLEGVDNRRSRGDFSLHPEYVASVRALREKYADRIAVFLGYECEAYRSRFPYYRELLTEQGFDFLILGNHSYLEDDRDVVYYFHRPVNEEKLKGYCESLLQGMETGLFSAVAHPDYYMDCFEEWNGLTAEVGERIVDAAVRLGIPLEFNLSCFRRGRKKFKHSTRYGYPVEEFWKLAKEKGAKTIVGVDAHHPEDLRYEYKDAYGMLERLGIEPLLTLPFADKTKIRLP
ncbi:MAG: histidinol-phosphatase [Lachnospiraceae bacterium]|nr:histidinol-phosphatase [Lachnospiraceae bacterium]